MTINPGRTTWTDEYEIATTRGARRCPRSFWSATAQQARRGQCGFWLWLDNGGGRLADKVRPEAAEAKAKQAVAEFQAHKQAQTADAELLAESWTEVDKPTVRTPLF